MLQSKIRRGEMDREVLFIERVLDETRKGEDYVLGWNEVGTDPLVAARKRELHGNEVVIDNQVKYMQRTEFLVDYRTDITTMNRLVYNDKVYEIIAITDNDMSRNSYLNVMCNLLDTETYTPYT